MTTQRDYTPGGALPRRFLLDRLIDHTGISGTGIVAHGVLFPDGACALHWGGAHPSTVVWADMADLLAVHGHGGATRIRWLDPARPATLADTA